MAPILCGTAHRSAIYGSCGAGVLAIQPPKAAVGGLRNVIAPKTFGGRRSFVRDLILLIRLRKRLIGGASRDGSARG